MYPFTQGDVSPAYSRRAKMDLSKKEAKLAKMSPMQREAQQIIDNSNNLLRTMPANLDIAQSELKELLQLHNTELAMQTSEILQELDFGETKALKKLYNYTLQTMRENRELADDVQQEYKSIKRDSAMMGRIKAIDKQLSFAAMLRKRKKEVMDRVYSSLKDAKIARAHAKAEERARMLKKLES